MCAKATIVQPHRAYLSPQQHLSKPRPYSHLKHPFSFRLPSILMLCSACPTVKAPTLCVKTASKQPFKCETPRSCWLSSTCCAHAGACLPSSINFEHNPHNPPMRPCAGARFSRRHPLPAAPQNGPSAAWGGAVGGCSCCIWGPHAPAGALCTRGHGGSDARGQLNAFCGQAGVMLLSKTAFTSAGVVMLSRCFFVHCSDLFLK